MIKTSFFLFILVIQLWPACSDEPSVDLHCLHECSCTEWELKRINQFADTYSFLSTAFDAYYSACNGIKSYDIQLDETGCQIVNCTGGIVLADANTTCIEIRDYPPDALCSIYYRAPHFSVYFTDDGWEFEMYCVEVVFERIDVADDVLILETASDVVTRISKVLTDSDSGASMISKVEGVLLSLVSNQDNEGSGFRVLFNSYDTCGDGFVDYPQEECDIWTNTYEIYCNACCQISEGAVCSELCGRTTECHTACGDGVVQSELGEECDPGDVEDYLCQNCLVVDDVRYDNFTAFCDSSDPPLLTEPSGTIFSGYAADAYCYWSVLPSDNECLVWAIDENDIANEDIFIYSYPDFDEICHTLFTDVFCEGTTYSVGDYMPLSVQQAYVVLSANGDAEVGAGLHWEYSTMPDCGNGVLDGMENCDDGNRDDGDGCSACCVIEPEYTCYPASSVFTGSDAAGVGAGPSVCHVACGDGVVEDDDTTAVHEMCDDANDVANDGCDQCEVQEGYVCVGNPSTCWIYGCGNGHVDDSEECDDGNDARDDGCVDCLIQPLYICEGAPSNCSCVYGSTERDGVCEVHSQIILEVGRPDQDIECTCFHGNPEHCCLRKALQYVMFMPPISDLQICLDPYIIHYFNRGGNFSDHEIIQNRWFSVVPCAAGDGTNTSQALVDFEFGPAMFSISRSGVFVRDLTLRHSLHRGAIFNLDNSTGVFQSLAFEHCISVKASSAILGMTNSEMTMRQIAVVRSYGKMGAILVSGGVLTMDDSVLMDNVGSEAGAITLSTSRYIGRISDFRSNNLYVGGNTAVHVGAIQSRGSKVNMTNTVINANFGMSYDGTDALHLEQPMGALISSTAFVANGYREIPQRPLAAYSTFVSNGGSLVMTDVAFINNSALIRTPLDNNFVGHLGGAMYISDLTHVEGMRLGFVLNAATQGGAAYIDDAEFSCIECDFTDNAAVEGGTFYVASGTSVLSVTSSSVSGSEADSAGVIYVGAGGSSVFRNVQYEPSDTDSNDDIVGAVKTCGDSVSCGQNAVCMDMDLGVACTCPNSMRGDPFVLCYDQTSLEMRLQGGNVERTLIKPAHSDECIVIASTGGIGHVNQTTNWKVVSIEPPSPWVKVGASAGSVQSGYCGSTEEDWEGFETDDFTSFYESFTTIESLGENSTETTEEHVCADVSVTPDADVLPVELSTSGLVQGIYHADLILESDATGKQNTRIRLSLTILTHASGEHSTVRASQESQPIAQCGRVATEVDKAVEVIVEANDVDGMNLRHGNDVVGVWTSNSTVSVCEGTQSDKTLVRDHSVDVLSLVDEQSGIYRVRLSCPRAGGYWVHFHINSVEVSNSPIYISAKCGSDMSTSEDGTCHSRDYTLQTVIFTTSVCGGGLLLLFSLRWIFRHRKRKRLFSDFGWKVFLLCARVGLDLTGVCVDWLAVRDVRRTADLEAYRNPYTAFAAVGTVLVFVLVVLMSMTVFFPKAVIRFNPMRLRDNRALQRPLPKHKVVTAKQLRHHFLGMELAQPGEDGAEENSCTTPDEKQSLHARRRITELEYEIAMARATVRNMVFGILVSVLKDGPIALIAAHTAFSTDATTTSIVLDMCLCCVNGGLRLQGVVLILEARRTRAKLRRKIDRTREKEDIQSGLAHMSLQPFHNARHSKGRRRQEVGQAASELNGQRRHNPPTEQQMFPNTDSPTPMYSPLTSIHPATESSTGAGFVPGSPVQPRSPAHASPCLSPGGSPSGPQKQSSRKKVVAPSVSTRRLPGSGKPAAASRRLSPAHRPNGNSGGQDGVGVPQKDLIPTASSSVQTAHDGVSVPQKDLVPKSSSGSQLVGQPSLMRTSL
eukprot:Rmarinus@m.28875